MPTPVVEFRSVGKRFGAGPAVLGDITLSAARGEFLSFIGPSGCGKSTLLRIIAGLSPVSVGTVTVDGANPGTVNPDLAFVFQEPTLLPWLTAAENIGLPQKLRRTPSRRRQPTPAALLDLVRLADKGDAYPRQLSGGQKMRVSLARALALSPSIVLLDEPFGSLDEMTREHLNEELLRIRERDSWTAFFVTHSVAEAVFLSSRIVVLQTAPGRIHADIAVPLPYPRTRDTRSTPAYQRLVVEVSRILQSAGAPAT